MYSWSEKAINGSNGYAVVEAVNASYLYWEYIDSSNDIVYDRMTLIQPAPIEPPSTDDSPNDDNISNAARVGAIIAIIIASLCVVSGVSIMAYLAPDHVKLGNRHTDSSAHGAIEATVVSPPKQAREETLSPMSKIV